MSFETFSLVLNAADFPFVANFFERTVTLPSIDPSPRLPGAFSGDRANASYEVAQHYYVQNVMPTSKGLQSVSYSQIIAALLGAIDFDQVITLRDADENNFLFAPARGKNYIYRADVGAWVAKTPLVGWLGNNVTRSYVNGRTFVCYELNSVWEYNTATDTFNPSVLIGISAAAIDCIGASNNYNIAVTGITVCWSSLIDPLDFTPSRQTGAGQAIPQDIKGVGRVVVPIAGGFVIYTTKNAILALYTNNATAPFVFKEISNAGGVISPEHISVEANLGYHYAWTTNGLQKISATGAEDLSTGAADFLAGRVWEEFDLSTNTITYQRLWFDLVLKLTYVSGRYLVISYGKPVLSGPQIYTHALVFDTSTKRWGKLRIDHVDCFSYPYPNFIATSTSPPPKRAVAFLWTDGSVQLMVMDFSERQDNGVLILGRFQLVRQKMMTHQKLELEGTHQAYPPDVYLIISPDGKTNNAPVKLFLLADAGDFKTYGAPDLGLNSGNPSSQAGAGAQRTGKNLSYLIKGTFELSTAIGTFTRHGNR